jgi:hypothetical protein
MIAKIAKKMCFLFGDLPIYSRCFHAHRGNVYRYGRDRRCPETRRRERNG